MKFKIEDSFQLINLQYGVCFGFLFSTFFSVEESGTLNVHLKLLSDYWAFYVMLLYFFLEWGIYNLTKDQVTYNVVEILLMSIGIWFLGYVTLLPRSNTNIATGQMLLGAYFFIANILRWIFYAKTQGTKERKIYFNTSISVILTSLQILLCIYMIGSSLAIKLYRPEMIDSNLINYLSYIMLFTVMRLGILIHLNLNIEKTT